MNQPLTKEYVLGLILGVKAALENRGFEPTNLNAKSSILKCLVPPLNEKFTLKELRAMKLIIDEKILDDDNAII